MARAFYGFVLLGLLAASGCAMCSHPFDYAFHGYGGRWQRQDMCHGRVGSIIQPAGDPVYVTEGSPMPGAPTPANVPNMVEGEMAEGEMIDSYYDGGTVIESR